MHDFRSTFTADSKVCEGVRIVYHRFTSARRRDMRLATAELTAKLRELAKEHVRSSARLQAYTSTGNPMTIEEVVAAADDNVRLVDLSREMDDILNDELTPQWIAWGVAAVEGLTIDGQPASLQDLARGPEALYKEIVGQLQREIGIDEPERKNSRSLSTSQPPADGESKSTTAATAESQTSNSTAPAIVPSITPIN